jgi:coenzyme F420-dependent glucose-6-phosphate dehydrogenase
VTSIGIHASHELYPPDELLRVVKHAEAAGFQAAMCSDHFQPWTLEQGDSGFAWSWLGAALEATQLSFGTVCAPGQRYHPAIIAQAAATLAQMYPQRFWVALGTGQALNESITGQDWPAKPARRARLMECVYVMRALWAGEEVTHYGHVSTKNAKLHTRPAQAPIIVGAAITEDTAEWVGGWADALITVGRNRDDLRKIIQSFHQGGGEGKPMFLQAALSWAPTEEEAVRAAHQRWPVCALDVNELQDVASPGEFSARVKSVTTDQVREKIRVSADLHRHLDWLCDDFELGFDTVYLHHVGGKMNRFIDVFASEVLPQLVGACKPR